MNKNKEKQLKRARRQRRIRGKVSGTEMKPRLSVFRSNSHIYAQLINDDKKITITSTSDLKVAKGKNVDRSTAVGEEIAKIAKTMKISKVVFDRGGYKYHGRVKAVADGARKGGLNF